MDVVHWLLDRRLVEAQAERPSGFPTLAQAAHDQGHVVHLMDYDPCNGRFDAPPWPKDTCVVGYGRIQFISQLQRRFPHWQPGSYARREALGYLAAAGNYGDMMLNDDFILLPFGEIVRRGCDGLGEAFFLKPECVNKSFTGFVMTRERWDVELETLHQKSSVSADTLCVVAKPREIEAEFRFVIADRKVIGGSQYRWDDRLDVRLDVTPVCLEMAERVAAHPWQPDRVYVCDVALVEDRSKARIVELNGFSSSGLYALDTRDVVRAVSHAAWSEYAGYDP